MKSVANKILALMAAAAMSAAAYAYPLEFSADSAYAVKAALRSEEYGSLRAYGDDFLGEHYEVRPLCSNEGELTFIPSVTGERLPVQGPDYYCKEYSINDEKDMREYISYPAFFFFKISKSGDLILEISQVRSDVDYIIWGPFPSMDVRLSDLTADKIDYTIYYVPGSNNYHLPNCYTCSISHATKEYAVINGAKEGDYYILVVSNYGRTSNPISIIHQPGNTAETDCSITETCGFMGSDIREATYYSEGGTEMMDIKGEVRFYNAPTSGTLTITDAASNKSATYRAPFSSPLQFEIDGLTYGGKTERELRLSFSDGDCDITMTAVAPSPPDPPEPPAPTPALTLTVAKTDNTVCFPDAEIPCNGTASVNVAGGVSPYSYLWSNGSASSNLSGLCSGKYVVTVTDSNGSTAKDSVTIATAGTGTLNVNEGSVTICPGESYEYRGQAFTTAGTMSVRVAGIGGCDTIYNRELSFYSVEDEYITASFPEGGSYEFRGVTYSAAGTYQIPSETEDGCSRTTYLTLTTIAPDPPEPPAPTPELTLTVAKTDNTVCFPDAEIPCNGTASAVVSGGVPYKSEPYYRYSWSNGETTPSISNLCEGIYVITVTDSLGNSVNDSVTIATAGTGTLNVNEGSVMICPGESYEYRGQAFTTAGTMSVRVAGIGGCDTIYNRELSFYSVEDEYITATIESGGSYEFYGSTYTRPGTYSVRHPDANGCTMTSHLTLYISGCENAKIEPSPYFTPNGDGENDLWMVAGLECIPSHVYIYDRFGRMLVRSDDFQGWDGYYNGRTMPSGDYWFLIKEKATGLIKTGHFTLHRGK